MNAERRKQIDAAILLVAYAQEAKSAAQEAIDEIAQAEREYFDNMPESLQAGEKGQRAEEVSDALDEAVSSLDGMDFDEVNEALENAK